MADVVLGLGSVFCGCQANVFLLELILKGSPDTLYALTCVQYVCIAFLSLPVLLRLKEPHENIEGSSSMWPLRWRRRRIPQRNSIMLAAMAWSVSVANNIALNFDVSVPLHATFRSSSLMVNMLAGYLFLNKRFTLPQVLCALSICVGLIALTLERSRKANAKGGSEFHSDPLSTPSMPTWRGTLGIAILVCTAFCTAGLGVFQEYVFRDACKREAERGVRLTTSAQADDDVSPMWAEALCTSHLYAIPLFFLHPSELFLELANIHSGSRLHVLLNCLTQLVCIAGVFIMSQRTSAFTLTLTLTLRKLATITISIFYFGHYRTMTVVEWVAMVGALAAGTAYAFLPKAHPANEAPRPATAPRGARSASARRRTAVASRSHE
ncbi:hypothetical protein ABL78_8052 [Leptomonas seymouri]|uniref:Uncharacterized protein n=1 Tax=Leptomonas seymouri TaxID=5684 RepID=A0A0N1HT61_LEPSE|nr:hypothetical protein ABL78_8052 [Leptomonas seymouri]|eukprot:KPI82932.1 hypothetical protein ABL78_8052 [Leptomonas seymouri]